MGHPLWGPWALAGRKGAPGAGDRRSGWHKPERTDRTRFPAAMTHTLSGSFQTRDRRVLGGSWTLSQGPKQKWCEAERRTLASWLSFKPRPFTPCKSLSVTRSPGHPPGSQDPRPLPGTRPRGEHSDGWREQGQCQPFPGVGLPGLAGFRAGSAPGLALRWVEPVASPSRRAPTPPPSSKSLL